MTSSSSGHIAEHSLLLDSDIFIILGGCGLLGTTLTDLGFQETCAYRLQALPYMLKKGKLKNTYPKTLLNRVDRWTRRIAAITDAPVSDVDRRMIDATDGIGENSIQPGEAMLLALVMENPSYYLATGDKRALKALASTPALRDIRDAVAGRVICLETVVSTLILKHGHQSMAEAFEPMVGNHGTLSRIFSSPGRALQVAGSCRCSLAKTLGEGFLYST